MFVQPLDFTIIRTFRQAIGFYLAHWLYVMIGSLLFSLPTVFWWGTQFNASSAEEYLKLMIAASHAICAVWSFALTLQVAKAKNLQKSWLAPLLATISAIASGIFASPPVPIIAAILSVRHPEQTSLSKLELSVGAVLILLALIVYFFSGILNQ